MKSGLQIYQSIFLVAVFCSTGIRAEDYGNSSRFDTVYNHSYLSKPYKPMHPNAEKDIDKDRVRTHSEGIQDLSIETFNPLNVMVASKIGNAVSSLELSTRRLTETQWEFSAINLNSNRNLWDERGRALLIPGNLSCRISHRVTLADYSRVGLTLGLQNVNIVPGAVQLSLGAGGSFEKMQSDYFEQSERCSIGPIPAFTTVEQIKELCRPCFNEISKTLAEDVRSRMSSLTYLVNTPICQQDSECEREDAYWTTGRCVLVRDSHDSYYSECQARSKIGGTCPGEGSSRMFQYKCDAGLNCVQVHTGNFWAWSVHDRFNQFICQDPKRPWKKTPT